MGTDKLRSICAGGESGQKGRGSQGFRERTTPFEVGKGGAGSTKVFQPARDRGTREKKARPSQDYINGAGSCPCPGWGKRAESCSRKGASGCGQNGGKGVGGENQISHKKKDPPCLEKPAQGGQADSAWGKRGEAEAEDAKNRRGKMKLKPQTLQGGPCL